MNDNNEYKEMMPKEFISKVLIKEIGEIHQKYPYLSFALMAIGIEFLGKCLNEHEDWNVSQSKTDFELAVKKLKGLSRYTDHLKDYDLWDSLRNGFAHSFVPKNALSLSSGAKELSHGYKVSRSKINLKCEDFYLEFEKACNHVIELKKFNSGKMDRPLLNVPKLNL